MDPITHAASGAILALTLKEKPKTRYFVPWAALVAASPDIDVIFASAPIDFLLLHRGITHSIFAIPFMSMLFALLLFPLWQKRTQDAWTYAKTCSFAAVLLLLHMWLDCITTYGTMIFLPFSEYRVRLNGVFIIDFLLIIPMILTLILGRSRRNIAVLGLIWIFLYPTTCVGLRMWHEHDAKERLSAENITNIAVLPDAFAPFFWRLIYQDDKAFDPIKNQEDQIKLLQQGELFSTNTKDYEFTSAQQSVHHQGLNFLGHARTATISYPALSQDIAKSLEKSSRRAVAYLNFSLMPIFEVQKIPQGEQYLIYDLRFGTMLPFVQSIMQKRNDGAPPFLFLAKRQEQAWTDVRLLFGGSGKDSDWQKPIPPRPVSWWEWLVGIY